MKMKCILSLTLTAAVTTSMADSVLVDRGLPTSNLNNAAGANRSNGAWADQESSSTPTEKYLPGDDFTIAGPGAFDVNKITVWTTGANTAGLTLYGGKDGSSTYSPISTSYTSTSVKYANGDSYQGTGGSFIQLNQVTFDTTGLNVDGGQKFDFFLDGPYLGSDGNFINSFLHASNAALSGSTQDGSDNLFQFLHVNGAAEDVEPFDSNGHGWDKSSDANILVEGIASSVPDRGATALMLGAGMVGLVGLRRKVVQTRS